jgi:hypothetical protein
MNFDEALDKVLVLAEDAASKAALLGQRLLGRKSRWPAKEQITPDQVQQFVLSLTRWDPTGETGKYLPYIVQQLSRSNLRIAPGNDEDGPRMLSALEFFEKVRKTPQWTGPRDINQFRNWRALEGLAEKEDEGKFASKRQQRKEASKGAEKVFEIVLPNSYRTKYTIYKITEPEAAVRVGMGTRWCTTSLTIDKDVPVYYRSTDAKRVPVFVHPEWHPKAGTVRELDLMDTGSAQGYPVTAISYLNNGPLYIVFRKDHGFQSKSLGRSGQLLQFVEDGSEIMSVIDKPLFRCSKALDYAMAQWAEQPGAPMAAIKVIRSYAR